MYYYTVQRIILKKDLRVMSFENIIGNEQVKNTLNKIAEQNTV